MITATNPPRFLIIQTAFIGDVILATALLEQLHQVQPGAVLDVLVRKGNESLLTNHPFVNEVLIWHKKEGKYRDLWRLIQTIRTHRYDAVLNLQRHGSMGLLTALSGAKTTIGFGQNPFARFFSHQVDYRFEPGVHETERNAAMLYVLEETGLIQIQSVANEYVARPKLYPSASDYAVAKTYQNRPYVCIAPMSVWFTKQYPAERWVDLIQSLPPGLTMYLLGAPTDTAACEAIRDHTQQEDRVVNLAGKLTLLQSAALQQGAVMNYVNDSAPLHLCSAMNAPTTAIFCGTVPEFGFGPLADEARVVQTPEPLDCRPCNLHGRKACPLGHFRCAWGIQVEELVEVIV